MSSNIFKRFLQFGGAGLAGGASSGSSSGSAGGAGGAGSGNFLFDIVRVSISDIVILIIKNKFKKVCYTKYRVCHLLILGYLNISYIFQSLRTMNAGSAIY